jgi:hypothetical protein
MTAPASGKPALRSYLRLALGALFLALALTFAVLAYESLSKLRGYRDSPLWIYITYGSVAALLSMVCLTVAAKSFRRG